MPTYHRRHEQRQDPADLVGPGGLYNEPKERIRRPDFIGESNILDGVMLEDYVVKFFGRKFSAWTGLCAQ